MLVHSKLKRIISRFKRDEHDETGAAQAPEILPTGGSAAQERLREAEHQEGKAPPRKGAEPDKRD